MQRSRSWGPSFAVPPTSHDWEAACPALWQALLVNREGEIISLFFSPVCTIKGSTVINWVRWNSFPGTALYNTSSSCFSAPSPTQWGYPVGRCWGRSHPVPSLQAASGCLWQPLGSRLPPAEQLGQPLLAASKGLLAWYRRLWRLQWSGA